VGYVQMDSLLLRLLEVEDDSSSDEDYDVAAIMLADLVEPEQDEDRIYNFLEMHRKIEDPVTHSQLRDDLVEHLWQIHGQ